MKKFLLLTLILILTTIPCHSKNKQSIDGKGYLGTLPDISKNYTPSEATKTKPIVEQVENFNNPNILKPIPKDNPSFVNIILKEDKHSQYLNDINEFIPMLEKIYDAIENNETVQIFNAKVYLFNRYAEYFYSQYNDKPEGNYISFSKLMELNTHAKAVAVLRSEALKYNPYLAYSGTGYIYDPNNITQQIEYLKTEIHQTILLLKDTN